MIKKNVAPTTAASRNNTWKWITGIVCAVVIAVWAGLSFMRLDEPERDYSTMRQSDNSLYTMTIQPSQDPVPINSIHTWKLHLETPSGETIENATITVDGDMPQHGHGLPTQPKVTQYLGNGDYLVEGMKFQMTGWWVMDFDVTTDGKTDHVQFNLLLE